MHLLKIFGKKKKTKVFKGLRLASPVHPFTDAGVHALAVTVDAPATATDTTGAGRICSGGGRSGINRAKVLQLLGAESEIEFLEIDDLLMRACAAPACASTHIEGAGLCPSPSKLDSDGEEIMIGCGGQHVDSQVLQWEEEEEEEDEITFPLPSSASGSELIRDEITFPTPPSSTERHSSASASELIRHEITFPTPPSSTERHYLPAPTSYSYVKDTSMQAPMAHPLPTPRSPKSSTSSGSRTQREISRNLGQQRVLCPPRSSPSHVQMHCSIDICHDSKPALSSHDDVNSSKPTETCSMPGGLSVPSVCRPLPSRDSSASQVSRRPQTLLLDTNGFWHPNQSSSVKSQSPGKYLLPQKSPSSMRASPARRSALTPLSCSRHTPMSPRYSPPHSPWSSMQRAACPHKWSKGAMLGRGSFGAVYEGMNQEDGSFFAVKISCHDDISPEIQHEVAVLSKLEHPNIVRYLGSSVEEGRLCIFLELVRMGSLEKILQKYNRFEDNMIRTYTRQILLGLEYLHQKKTMHRDIKCANILVDVNGQVKLSDFGVAKQVEECLFYSVKGTPLFMAPEVLAAKKGQSKKCHYSFPADIWSLGCTVLEMADGKPPWSDLPGFQFFFKVKKGELPPISEHLSSEGKDFVLRCLKFKPEDRPTATELLQHPFVANVPTPDQFVQWSPPSPVAREGWPASSVATSTTWACGNLSVCSPSQASCFDQVVAGAQRAQTLLYG